MTDAAARIAARLAELWQSSRVTVLERVATLEAAEASLSRNPDDGEARSSGREAAHKLAGVLGVFGLPRGSELASQIEDILLAKDPLRSEDLKSLKLWVGELAAVITSKEAGTQN